MRVKARVLAERIMPYSVSELTVPEGAELDSDVVMMLVNRDTMATAESLRTLEGAQVVAPDHEWVTPENAGVSKGNTAGASRIEGPYLEIDLLITDPKTIEDIEQGKIGEISAGYHAETIFEDGDFDGQKYQARQTCLRFNHIAVIPYGHGRAGSDVRIINKKTEGGKEMSVKVMLKNTKRFVNTDEDGAAAIEAESAAAEESGTMSAKSLEDTMSQLAEANAKLSEAQSEAEELKGELSVYKQKLDALLDEGAIEKAAEGMIEETAEAEEIIENTDMKDEKGEPLKEDEKEKVMNSIRKLHGEKLHRAVLSAAGVQVENMSAEAVRGAFKAQSQIIKNMCGKKHVAGAKLMNSDPLPVKVETKVRNSRERLGLK